MKEKSQTSLGMKKRSIFLIAVFLCLSLSACQAQQTSSGVDDSYLEGMKQAKEDFFLTIWKAAYDQNSKDFGEMWETDDFSMMITSKRKTEAQSTPNAPYLEIDFTLNRSNIELYWNTGSLRFYIYSVTADGRRSEVGNSDWFYDYFELGGTIEGNKGYTDVLPIYEDANVLLVVIVVDDRIYATSYDVDI